jgi:hypothetical protein
MQGDGFPSDKFIPTLIAFLMLFCLLSTNNLFDIGSGIFFHLRFPWVILLVLLPVFKFSEKQTKLMKRNGQLENPS